MRRRRGPVDPLPVPLQTFVESDWSEWLLNRPDPAAEAYVDLEVFYRGLADKPAVAACYRRRDARTRWHWARRAWLKMYGYHDLAFDDWIDEIGSEHRILDAELREASG